MSIILYLGKSVKEYESVGEKIIKRGLKEGNIRCESCTQPMKRHSSYTRTIKETGQEIEITMVWCKPCKNWHAVTPDFLLRNKHYSGNEIESVIIDSATVLVLQIETEASESTVRRWINQIGERIKRAIRILEYIFWQMGKAVGMVAINAKTGYSELENILEMAPSQAQYSGNKLGLANIWLGYFGRTSYI